MELSRSELQLESIVRRITDGELDLQPDFQRGEIWDNRRRQRLIDSILRNWYVPAVHIVQDEDGNEIVLDGQQRLAAIRDFFADRFKVDGRIQPENENVVKLHGLKFSGLPEAVRKSIRRFALPVITLKEFEPQEPNELFFRLNQSYNLTPPEKRNALHGAARDQIKQAVRGLSELGLLSPDAVGFSNGRLAYDDIVARTCVALEHDDLGIHINNNVVEAFYRGGSFSEQTVVRIEESGAELLGQIRACSERVRFNKGTLFTWLIYIDWASAQSGGVPGDLLASFERDRSNIKSGDVEEYDPMRRRMLEVVSLYDDRAAYRVTDVSSVLTRDLALHLYSVYFLGTRPIRGADELVARIVEPSSVAVSTIIADFLAARGWGANLLELRD